MNHQTRQLTGESGSTLILVLILIAILGGLVSFTMAWAGEARDMQKIYRRPAPEISFFVRSNLSCAKTKLVWGTGTSLPQVVEARTGNNSPIVSSPYSEFKDRSGKITRFRIQRIASTQLRLEIASPTSTDWDRIGVFTCR